MSKDLTRRDIQDAASILGCEIAAIKAVTEVECRGSGFDDQDRPVILFEPHIFERQLNKIGYQDSGSVIQDLRARGLCSPRWNRKLYARNADGRWKQLQAAMEIDQEAALKSASYGIGQVCGFNHAAAGYGTATEMVEAMAHSEGQQLLAMVNFILGNKLDDEIRDQRWADFARKYNGPAYAQNEYDIKLEKAYRKHSHDPEAFWAQRPNHGWAASDVAAGIVPEGEDPAPTVDSGKDDDWEWI